FSLTRRNCLFAMRGWVMADPAPIPEARSPACYNKEGYLPITRRRRYVLSQAPTFRLHADPVARSDRHHRGADPRSSAPRPEGPRGRGPHEVLQQPQADRPRPPQLPRHLREVSPRLEEGERGA